jgi:hypothetical protein
MKITVTSGLNPVEVLRRAGYGQVMDRRATEVSYNRRLGSGFYPRFHAYINGDTINLHLDQKQASYEGYGAHGGEYDGDTVETEGERIIQSMSRLSSSGTTDSESGELPEKTGFWSKILG